MRTETVAFIDQNRERLSGELQTSGLCSDCAALFLDCVRAVSNGREDVETEDFCSRCDQLLFPRDETAEVLAALRKMTIRGDEEVFQTVRSIIEGWRPGKVN